MRARAAYISSFGTTGVLVAAALLVLATVSALVAFHAWPGSAPIDSVAPMAVGAPHPPAALRSSRAPATAARRAPRPARTRVSTAGLVKVAPPAASTRRPAAGGGQPSVVTITHAAPLTAPSAPTARGAATVRPRGGPPPPQPPVGQVQHAVSQLLPLPPLPGDGAADGATAPAPLPSLGAIGAVTALR
jgi:hypothetical protein